MKIGNQNFNRLWTNAKIIDTELEGVFSCDSGDNEYAVTFSVDADLAYIASSSRLKITASRTNRCVLSVVMLDDVETRRINIIPFYKNGAYLIPLEIFNASATEGIKEIRFHIKGKFDIKSIEIADFLIEPISLKIMLHSGIGDCLRALMRNSSITAYAKRYPCNIYWAYAGRGLRNSSWEELLNKFVLGRNTFFTHVSNEDFENIDACELFNGYGGDVLFSGYIEDEVGSIEVNLSRQERFESNKILNHASFRIGIQLQGNDPKKTFPTEKWVELFTFLLQKYPLANIFIMDGPTRTVDQSLLFDRRIVSLIGVTNMAQNINLIQKMDLWISPDSFSKYVAAWGDVRQVIMCCRLPYNQPKEMLISAFDVVGLLMNPRIKLVGLNYDEFKEVSTIMDDVRDINVEDILSFC